MHFAMSPLTLKQSSSARQRRRLGKDQTTIGAGQAFRHFMNLLNRAVYGDGISSIRQKAFLAYYPYLKKARSARPRITFMA